MGSRSFETLQKRFGRLVSIVKTARLYRSSRREWNGCVEAREGSWLTILAFKESKAPLAVSAIFAVLAFEVWIGESVVTESGARALRLAKQGNGRAWHRC